jgi:hypothetical protein
VALAAVFALVVLGTSFPLSALLSQHGALSSTSAQLRALQHENSLLAEQQQQLDSTTDVDRLARQDYQMVSPGQTLFDVLPPSGLATASAGGSTPGDPGSDALVSPADAPDMTPDPNLPTVTSSGAAVTDGNAGTSSPVSASPGRGAPAGSAASGSATPASAPSSFWSRVTDTLEFWK